MKQIIRIVKERNKLYNALVKIHEITDDCQSLPDIKKNCEIALRNTDIHAIPNFSNNSANRFKGSFYWDCECETHYIHLSTDRLICPRCGVIEEKQPESIGKKVAQESKHFILN